MPAFISISKKTVANGLIAVWITLLAPSMLAMAADKTVQPEEDDFSSTPFTEYGEFNEQRDEDEVSKFFQYGRFFGVSIGLGYNGVTGNRGALYQGGFPLLDFKVHYWFDFNFALQLGVSTVTQYFDSNALGHTDVSLVHLGGDLKYYFPTQNLSSAVSFGNPFILLGVGTFTKGDSNPTEGTTDSDTSFAITAGAGLEFVISPRKTYFALEGKYNVVTFKDTYTTNFRAQDNLPDLTGGLYSITGSILFTW